MKRHLLSLCILLAALPLFAGSYTVSSIPNVQLSDARRFVSNPDGILSPATQSAIDRMLGTLKETNTTEAAVVAIESIGDTDPDLFATDLFTSWGIGQKNDNGLLILLVLDQRRIVFRTGYGLEGVLPDIICKRIQQRYIIPAFRQGDYDTGMLRGVEATVQALSSPEANEELRYTAPPFEVRNLLWGYGSIAVAVSLLLLWLVLGNLWKNRKREPYERYQKLLKYRTLLLCLSFPFPLFVLFLYWGVRYKLKRLRNKPRICDCCCSVMRKCDETEDNYYLTPQENAEEMLNSVDYDVWLCEKCGNTLVYPYENIFTRFKECPHCHARTYCYDGDHIVRNATALSEGRGEKRYHCEHCRRVDVTPYIIPIIIAGGIGGGSGRGGGGFGGGFGGGMTGGGGASSGW